MDLEITILAKADIGAGCLFGIAYILAVLGQSGSNPALFTAEELDQRVREYLRDALL